ncbi:response regulator [Pontibacter russatus]|uniref:response regulator n=1 Tax=Pontibacter russatus TaxID=2694929 RepID=UPI001379CC96|nr:response regulator [Pontibacter russatus]
MKRLANILLIDDDPVANFVNKKLMEKMAVVDKVLMANNGKVAIQLLEEQSDTGLRLDFILLDINMPVMNGIEFMKAYHELELKQKDSITVIILTTSNHPRDLESFAQLPVAGFLNKPLTIPNITALLEEHFTVPCAVP